MHNSRAEPQYNCSFQILTFQHLHVYSCHIYSQCLVAFHLNRNPGKEQLYSKQFLFCVNPTPPLLASRSYGFSRTTSTTNTIKFVLLFSTTSTAMCYSILHCSHASEASSRRQKWRCMLLPDHNGRHLFVIIIIIIVGHWVRLNNITMLPSAD